MDPEIFKKNCSENLTFFVGDVHGQFPLLMEALDEAGFDPKKGHVLFSVGDLIDRGPDNFKCIDLLDEPWFFAVRGNHEDLMIKTVLEGCVESSRIWANNGGIWAANYLNNTDGSLCFTDEMVCRAEKIASLPYMRAVSTKNTDQKFLLVHAEIPSQLELKKLKYDNKNRYTDRDFNLIKHSLIWKRTIADNVKKRSENIIDGISYRLPNESSPKNFYNKKYDLIISGHSPISKFPVMFGNQLFIDTGAGRGLMPTVINEIEIKNIIQKYNHLENVK